MKLLSVDVDVKMVEVIEVSEMIDSGVVALPLNKRREVAVLSCLMKWEGIEDRTLLQLALDEMILRMER